jgi:metal-responsive CopG/Arc/MetJ family transcriptional regulator
MSISVRPKKRGRPATGRDPVVAVRLTDELVGAIDRATKAGKTNRSEVIREALTEHLKAKGYLK